MTLTPAQPSKHTSLMICSKARMLIVCVFLFLASLFASASPPSKPNVLFILTDDLGYGDVGALFQKKRQATANPKQPWEETPHLDELAAGGVCMLQHYCPAPVCPPSPASLLTGVTQGHATSVTTNLTRRSKTITR